MSQNPYKITSPTLLPDGEKYDGEETYTRKELLDKGYEELRQMAAEVEADVINGKSTKMEIVAFFTNHRTLSDY